MCSCLSHVSHSVALPLGHVAESTVDGLPSAAMTRHRHLLFYAFITHLRVSLVSRTTQQRRWAHVQLVLVHHPHSLALVLTADYDLRDRGE
jgi:hypothetical protein